MEPVIIDLGQHSWGRIENVHYSIKSKGSLVAAFHMQNVLPNSKKHSGHIKK